MFCPCLGQNCILASLKDIVMLVAGYFIAVLNPLDLVFMDYATLLKSSLTSLFLGWV